MDIQIQNTNSTIKICDTIAEKNQKLHNACEQLKSCLTQINSNSEDKQLFITKLEKQMSNINFLNNSIDNITSSILSYADQMNKEEK